MSLGPGFSDLECICAVISKFSILNSTKWFIFIHSARVRPRVVDPRELHRASKLDVTYLGGNVSGEEQRSWGL